MTMSWRRVVLAAALSLTAAGGGLLVAGAADAHTVGVSTSAGSANPAPPPELELGLVVATDGTANGDATLHGTVSCTKTTSVTLDGSATEVNGALLTRGAFSTKVACTPDGPVPWTATAVPSGSTAFAPGDAQVTTEATGYDDDYAKTVVQDNTTVVQLEKAKP